MNKLTEEQLKLVNDNLGFVYHMSRRYSNVIDREDMIHEGMLGLIRAAQLFDKDKGFMFTTYSRNWIRYYMSLFFKRNRPTQDIEQIPIIIEETISQRIVSKDIADKALIYMTDILKLSERELDIMYSRYAYDNKTVQELGDKYGVSKQRITQIELKILQQLNQRFK